MRMRSFQVRECGAPLHVSERETPKPEGTQVLLKMLAAGVCHSDLHIWDGYYEIGGGKRLMLADRGIKLPLTMGHENVGEVVALGPEAKGGRSATCAWSIHGWAAANARCASGVMRTFASRRRTSACSRRAAMRLTCWRRIRAICSTSAILSPSRPRRLPAPASPPSAR